jgi:hypothetical protein
MYKELSMLGIHDLALFVVSGLLLNMMPVANNIMSISQ